MTEPEPLQQVDRTCVRYRNRRLACFSGCDYFRLASHPAVLQAMRDGLQNLGLNVAASRLTTGNHRIYKMLEEALGDFFHAEDALLLPSGYLGPWAVAQALAGTFSHALVDARAHPALLDASALLDCPVLTFKHRDAGDFRRTIARCGRGARPAVLTDGMFSFDGSIAPLGAYLECLPPDGLLLVDDAHGAGVLGKTGKGTLEAEGVSRRRVVQCITLSKAFGVYGGAVLGPRSLREKILNRSRLFVGSTPLPLPLASAALAAVRILKRDKRLRRRLVQNTNFVKTALRKAGFHLPETPGPIIALFVENLQDSGIVHWDSEPGRDALPRVQADRQVRPTTSLESDRAIGALKRRLLAAGIYPPLLKYPGGPDNRHFRFVISSEHSRAQLDNLIEVLTRRG